MQQRADRTRPSIGTDAAGLKCGDSPVQVTSAGRAEGETIEKGKLTNVRLRGRGLDQMMKRLPFFFLLFLILNFKFYFIFGKLFQVQFLKNVNI